MFERLFRKDEYADLMKERKKELERELGIVPVRGKIDARKIIFNDAYSPQAYEMANKM
jgi:hypothetical protein